MSSNLSSFKVNIVLETSIKSQKTWDIHDKLRNIENINFLTDGFFWALIEYNKRVKQGKTRTGFHGESRYWKLLHQFFILPHLKHCICQINKTIKYHISSFHFLRIRNYCQQMFKALSDKSWSVIKGITSAK